VNSTGRGRRRHTLRLPRWARSATRGAPDRSQPCSLARGLVLGEYLRQLS
jgi:hypothetical protein